MSDGNKKRNKASAGPILMRTAGILFAVTAITVWATSFLFAKFTTGGIINNNGRVAKFDVEVSGSQSIPDIDIVQLTDPADNTPRTGTYTVTLTNKSETTVSANLVLDFSRIGKLINNVTAKAGEGETATALSCTLNASDSKATTGSVVLAPAGTTAATKTVTLTLTFPYIDDTAADMDAINLLTQPMRGLSGEAVLPFDVFAVFTQID